MMEARSAAKRWSANRTPRVAIRRGLREGERVVVSAQFLIDSESNIDSALGRMESAQ